MLIRFRIYFLLFLFMLIHAVSANNIDSLKVQLNSRSGPDKTAVLLQLSKAYWTVAPSKGIFYANDAVELAEKYQDKRKKAKALLYAGVNAWFMGIYDTAIEYYQKSLTIAREIQDKRLSAYNLNNLGMVNTHLENYQQAIDNYTQSSHIIEQLEDTIELAKIQNNIAELNMLIGNYDKALAIHLSVLDIIETSDEQIFLIWIYNDIGNVYIKKGKNKLALEYYNKALKVSNKINNMLGRSKTMNQLGKVYLHSKEYDKAKEYFFDALSDAREVEAQENINEIYKNISGYYSAIDNYKKALEYYKLYKQLSDSVLNEKKIRTIVEMQARYDLERAENENRLLQKNLKINELTIRRNKTQRRFLALSLLITILLIILIYSRLRMNKKRNQELNEKNTLIKIQKDQLSRTLSEQQKLNEDLENQKKEVQSAQKKLELANKKLEETIATKDRFFAIIAHDLKGPIGNILSFAAFIQDGIHNYSSGELSGYISMMKTAAENTFDLLENLLVWARSQRGEIPCNPGYYDLKQLIEDAMAIFKLKSSDKNIRFFNNCTEPCICFFDKNMIKTTLTNLLNNATKYSYRNGEIKVDVQPAGTELQVSVSDNGIGMTPEVKASLFQMDSNHYIRKGTDGEKGTGLGLILAKEFIEKHSGRIWVASESGKGSTFSFAIPYISEKKDAE